MRTLGICLGASTVKAVIAERDQGKAEIIHSLVQSHGSDPKRAFSEMLKKIESFNVEMILVTGRKFKELIDAPSITEPESLEYASDLICRNEKIAFPEAVLSLGAENFILHILDNNGHTVSIETGGKCASGTGEFFFQQVRRMGLTVAEAVELAGNSEPYKVSGRCSVFCKSDCTHALNKGTSVGRVCAGLCRMIADKILDLLEKIPGKSVMAVGGVTKNILLIDMVREKYPSLFVPSFADVFEAVGTAICAFEKGKRIDKDWRMFVSTGHISFRSLPPLSNAVNKVRFESVVEKKAEDGNELIIGLDVGSTTTKAVALRTADNAMVGKVYLRTKGDPVRASRQCYESLNQAICAKVKIIGIGVTGSGRQISGLHAGTKAVINEIIAHSTAASYFDSAVDTIFEIGGQDAKYTYLTTGVPSDYAMNEACSAGTGSFLEEAALESLDIDYRKIGEIALQSGNPPDFSDQCAAFISSDIKTASHEGVSTEDITAGLVYSICMNYVNRVKGRRPVGKKIFMQGGVCYNKAVPLAMANLMDREIVVPPEPGLMGAFGVALEVKNGIARGSIEKGEFSLEVLALREITQGGKFICGGGREKCDRKCEINTMIIDGRKFPFGGACNKYYNLIRKVDTDSTDRDFTAYRQKRLFSVPGKKVSEGKRIGINRSFLTHMLYPLYASFFSGIGLRPVLSDTIDNSGIKLRRSSFCFPGEVSHGAYYSLLKSDPEYIFLPKVIELFVEGARNRGREHQCTCLLLQSEAYYLKSAFREIKSNAEIISPILDFSQGWDTQVDQFVEIGRKCGVNSTRAAAAYFEAVEQLKNFQLDLMIKGEEILNSLSQNPDSIAVVLFGRPYNAFTRDADMGIPEKLASCGVTVIPWDFLPIANETCDLDINWAIGLNLMKAAAFTSRHKQLFGVYVTNFSCGPDSFLLGYFRDYMKEKPSLTLELDSHTADAGVITRIEAFLDIVARYRGLNKREEEKREFVPARIGYGKKLPSFISSKGKQFDLRDPSVHLLFPSMGRLSSELIAAAFAGTSICSSALPVYDYNSLKTGRANTSCKECLPLILTTGGLLNYLDSRLDKNEKVVFFMPTCGGNCRFTQYNVFLKKLIEKKRIENTAVLSWTNENGYSGLSLTDSLNVLKAVIISDCMEDIKNCMTVLARNPGEAEECFERQWKRLVDHFTSGRSSGLNALLESISGIISKIPVKYSLSNARTVSLMGEIFVRRDYFSCRDLMDRLIKREIVVRRQPVLEWLSYCDFNVLNGIYQARFDLKSFLEFKARTLVRTMLEKKIKKIFSKSGFYEYEPVDVEKVLEYGREFFDLRFTGEAILVAGGFFREILHSIHGAVSIGPFSCMPTRVIEAVMSVEATVETKRRLEKNAKLPKNIFSLPFLSIETDGNPFPQILEARIEAFCLQVERLHAKLSEEKKWDGKRAGNLHCRLKAV